MDIILGAMLIGTAYCIYLACREPDIDTRVLFVIAASILTIVQVAVIAHI